MKTTYLVAYDMLTRSNARRTYSRWFDTYEEAERYYDAKRMTFSTIEIWMIKAERKMGVPCQYEYVHAPKYVWR
jgi:hypothetical protein